MSWLITTAFFNKLVRAGVPAWLIGMSTRTAIADGVAMSARGAVELRIGDLAFRAGLLEHRESRPPVVDHIFSAIVIVAVVMAFAVPLLLRPRLAHPQEKPLPESAD